jgi:hypothetical protein
MPASLIVSYFGLTGFTAAAVTLGVRIISTMAITSLIAKDMKQTQPQPGASGGIVQLPPATDNKLPVVYGDAWVSPIIVDAKISEDQQHMWYVLALSETTDSGTVSIDQVYWDDKILLFDPANPNTIRGWYNEADNTTVTGVGGKIHMWFYRDGSLLTGTTHRCISAEGVSTQEATTRTAFNVLEDEMIASAQRWTAANRMTKTVFAVCRVDYAADYGISGLSNSIKVRIKNTLKAPGSVLKDYLTNTRYGAGIPLANIDTDSLTALDTYSAQTVSLTNTAGGTDSGTRYQVNGILDTRQDCLTNAVIIADAADSWVQWNEATGKWAAIMNRSLTESGGSTSTMTVVNSNQIIGGIQISPLDLNNTYNSINVQFPNTLIRDQSDFRYYSIPLNQRFANEPENNLQLSLPLTNNSLTATYIGYKRLLASRSDITINFTMDYSGIQIDAGDIIAVNHEWYGWSTKAYGGQTYPGKPFRVTQVKEFKDGDGFLSVQITATAYNNSVYTTTNPHYYTPVSFSGITDPSYISTPDAPTIPSTFVDTTASNFVVQANIPAQGNVKGMEFWYSTSATVSTNNYTLYSVQNYNSGSLYPHQDANGNTFFEQVQAIGLPAGTYYWRSRAQGVNTPSDFSPASAAFTWAPATNVVNGSDILDNSIAGSKVITGDPATAGTPQGTGFFDKLGDVALLSLGSAAVYYGYKKGVFDDILPEEWGSGYDSGILTDILDPSFWSYEDTQYAQVGDIVEYVADATPAVEDWFSFANFDDYDVASYDGDIFGDFFG